MRSGDEYVRTYLRDDDNNVPIETRPLQATLDGSGADKLCRLQCK